LAEAFLLLLLPCCIVGDIFLALRWARAGITVLKDRQTPRRRSNQVRLSHVPCRGIRLSAPRKAAATTNPRIIGFFPACTIFVLKDAFRQLGVSNIILSRQKKQQSRRSSACVPVCRNSRRRWTWTHPKNRRGGEPSGSCVAVLGQKRQGTLAEPSPREHCTKDLHARSLTNDEVYATVAYGSP